MNKTNLEVAAELTRLAKGLVGQEPGHKGGPVPPDFTVKWPLFAAESEQEALGASIVRFYWSQGYYPPMGLDGAKAMARNIVKGAAKENHRIFRDEVR